VVGRGMDGLCGHFSLLRRAQYASTGPLTSHHADRTKVPYTSGALLSIVLS
jgi:hypothetical protein